MPDTLPTGPIKRSIIAGGSGLIGSHLIRFILQDPAFVQMTLILRNPISVNSTKITTWIGDMTKLPDTDIRGKFNVGFCCLGTTMKAAGSREAFRKIDFDLCLRFANICKDKGVQHFLLVSALGADPGSKIFYNRTKGELESAIKDLRFSSTTILRPSLLTGKRPNSRFGEKIGEIALAAINPFLLGDLKKYRAIAAEQVAKAMVSLAKKSLPGFHVIESDEIQKIVYQPGVC